MKKQLATIAMILAVAIGGCTVHPAGEKAERAEAIRAGEAYAKTFEERVLPELGPAASVDQMVNYALLNNGEVEQKYWKWRAALEKVPQEGTQQTPLMISLSRMINNGKLAWDTTTLSAGNDPMASIELPSKLRTRAEMALEEAKAASFEFDKARLELRAKVISAYLDYALSAELACLDEENLKLMELMRKLVEARVPTGGSSQRELLKTSSDVLMMQNELAGRRSNYPAQVAAINKLLNRDPATPIDLPAKLPATRDLGMTQAELLVAAAKRNPELLGLAHMAAANHQEIASAKQKWIPDFSVNVGTDLAGMSQSLMGSIALPVLKYEAINAAIAQAKANLRATEAMRRQTANDIAGEIVTELTMMNTAQAQADFMQQKILPQLERVVMSSRTAYASGTGMLLEIVDSQRSLIAVRRSIAEMRVEREKRAAGVEAMTGVSVTR